MAFRLPLQRASALVLSSFALVGGSTWAGQVHPDLAAAAQRQGRAEALIVLKDQRTPATATLPADADYKARRRALVAALVARADEQQRGLRAWMDARQIAYQPFWIANIVHARLNASELAALAERDEVARIDPNPTIAVALPRPTGQPAQVESVSTVAWGVDKIRAPLVWAQGITGQGVVIAGQDTGYRWDHPALKSQYRGWNGSTADHNYSWHDAIHVANGSCPANSPAPCDDNGHGTHTAGTFAGDDHATHQIGVAPGAKWIGCRNMNAGNGTPATYIECMQWLLAPTDLANQNPNPDLAPDIISNSWGCTIGEGCTVGNEIKGAVTNLVKGGILFVAAATNAGPSCGTITEPPAIYPLSYTIGATDSADKLASFSSRGPVTGKGVKPDVSAPGVNVNSAYPPNTYTNLSGTSMATPHVAGAAALLMSAVPTLKGNPAAVEKLLNKTAQRSGVTNPVNQTCGGTAATVWPNAMIGNGRIDVFAAYQKAIAGVLDTSLED
ncbi:S8 family serine peptidase [Ideonella alba]|uniref:S8 family serine peptidase n=1 Tax=Ideonella alba TaxID=2824118 RepID=A0A940YLT3_9BURK|nr:S8 family serine peptidase [Ideonella alba]MBQ0932144.1 S8 family serine peptidase [Ideonella alba]